MTPRNHHSIKAARNDADPLSFEFKMDIWGISRGLKIGKDPEKNNRINKLESFARAKLLDIS